MTSQMYFNYWTDKIEFKEKINSELLPLLVPYVGKQITQVMLEDIKKEVTVWMTSLDEVVFDCELKVEIEKKNDNGQTIDVIKVIRVVPIDV